MINNNLSLGKIVKTISYNNDAKLYNDTLSKCNESSNNTDFDFICEFELASDKIIAFIKFDEPSTTTNVIYTIYVCSKLEEVIYKKLNDQGHIDFKPAGFNDHGDSRVWGFYMNKLDAINALHFNMTDINETSYKYACIEAYEEGISHPIISETQWFEYEREANGYFEIDTPLLEDKCCCRAMG